MAIVNTHYGFCAKGGAVPKFTYTGNYNVRDDGVVELLTSGTLVFLNPTVIDVFCVGGGGAGYGRIVSRNQAYGGGGGGYTRTEKNLAVTGTYNITIGEGGTPPTGAISNIVKTGGDTLFGNLVTAEGGYTRGFGTNGKAGGGKGGSGGGGGVWDNSGFGAGGSDGDNGENGYPESGQPGGSGSGTSTREFGEPNGKLYAGGGGGGRHIASSTPVQSPGGSGGGGAGGWAYGAPQPAGAGKANTGGGGGGGVSLNNSATYSAAAGAGGSGIVCFREAK